MTAEVKNQVRFVCICGKQLVGACIPCGESGFSRLDSDGYKKLKVKCLAREARDKIK